MGVELSAMNIPVIVCGEGFIRNKEIATDVNSFREYDSILEKLPLKEKLNSKRLLRAKKYAYHFFFRRMIEIASIEEKPHKWPNIHIKKDMINYFKNNKDAGLEEIGNCIINEKDFIFQDEKINL